MLAPSNAEVNECFAGNPRRVPPLCGSTVSSAMVVRLSPRDVLSQSDSATAVANAAPPCFHEGRKPLRGVTHPLHSQHRVQISCAGYDYVHAVASLALYSFPSPRSPWHIERASRRGIPHTGSYGEHLRGQHLLRQEPPVWAQRLRAKEHANVFDDCVEAAVRISATASISTDRRT